MTDRMEQALAIEEAAALKRRTKEARQARVVKLAGDGLSAEEIGRSMGIGRDVVIRCLRAAGVKAVSARRGVLVHLPLGCP